MLDARTRAPGILAAATAVVAGSLAAAAPATAGTAQPAHPYITVPIARVVGATANSLTVSAHARNATRYRVWASTKKSAVYYSQITSGHASAPSSGFSRSSMTVAGLPYTTQPYYFRVLAINGKHSRSSHIYMAGVRPSTPTNVAVSSNHNQSFLTWTANAAGEVVQEASNYSFTSGVKTFHVRGAESQFTPTDLNRGQTYFLRVRADNYGSASSWSAPVAVQRRGGVQSLRVMTYNILEASMDGRSEGGQRIAPWSQRRSAAVHLIHRANPGVISVQEGASWVGHHQRQASNLAHAAGYKMAHTEITPGHPHWFRTGCYILYKRSVFRAVGSGNHWNLGPSSYERFAAYQILQNRSSGAKFLFVAPHLRVGHGRSLDQVRENETSVLISRASAFARKHGGLPIVYAGDFNSHKPNATISFDGPGIAMRAAHVADAIQVARKTTKAAWDSANLYQRKPPKTHVSIDHVYVSPGVGVYKWTQLMNLRHGRFVGVMPSDHNPVVADLAIPY